MGILLRPGFLVSAAAVCGVSIYLCTLPLLETLGIEYALLTALLASLATGLSAAGIPDAVRRRDAGRGVSLVRLYLLAAGQGTALAGIAAAVSLLNGLLFVPFCDLQRGLVFFFWMPLFSVWLAAAVGLAAGLIGSGAVRGGVLFALLWLATVGSGLWSFYATPAVYVFNPFGGFFPGVLYDRVVRLSFRLVTYRLGTVLEIAAVLSALAVLYTPDRIALTTERFRPRSTAFLVAGVCLLSAVLFRTFGGEMGHRTSRADLERMLPKRVTVGLLDLHFPDDTESGLIRELSEDAAFSFDRTATYFGIEPSHRVAVFFFRDTDEKGRVMGAGRTNVAKPWRREVYVTLDRAPHPVLRHELAHAVSADFAPGPFAVAGRYGGWIPNPGLIEGLATAAGGPRGDLTVHQWTRAMDLLGLLPPLENLVGFAFFDTAASSAYTAAGSFCDWYTQRFGSAALRNAYTTGDFSIPTKRPLQELETEWRRFLEGVSLTKADLTAAKARFDRTPVLRTRCVHATAELVDDGWKLLENGELKKGTALIECAHEKSGGATETARYRLLAANLAGDTARFRKLAEAAVASPQTDGAERSAVREMLLDLDVSEQRMADYATAYSQLAAESETEDRRRQLDVKAHLARTGVVDSRIFDVLSLSPGFRRTDPVLAALLIADEVAAHPYDPVRLYLEARQYFNVGDFTGSLRRIERARILGLDKAPLTVQLAARMLEGRALLGAERFQASETVFRTIASDEGVREGLRARAADFAERARFAARNAR